MSQWNLWQIKRPVSRKERRKIVRELHDVCKSEINSDENLTYLYRQGCWQRFFFRLHQRFAWLGDALMSMIIVCVYAFSAILCAHSFQFVAGMFFGDYSNGFPYNNSAGVLAVLGVIVTLIILCRKNQFSETHAYLAYWPIPDAGIIGTFWSKSILLSITYGVPGALALAIACYRVGWSWGATISATACAIVLTGISIVSVVEAIRRITPLSKLVHLTSYLVTALLSLAVLVLATSTQNEHYVVPPSTLAAGQLMPGFGWSLGVIHFLFKGETTGLAGALVGGFVITYAVLRFKNTYSLQEIDVDALENETLIRKEFQQPYKRAVVEVFPKDAQEARDYVSSRLETICTFADSQIFVEENSTVPDTKESAQQTKLLSQLGLRLTLLRMAIGKTNAAIAYTASVFITANAGLVILSRFRSVAALSPGVWVFWYFSAAFVVLSDSYFGSNLPQFKNYKTTYLRNYLPIDDLQILHEGISLRIKNVWPRLLIVYLGIALLNWLGVPSQYLVMMSFMLALKGLLLLPFAIALAFPFRENEGRLYWVLPLLLSMGGGAYGVAFWTILASRSEVFFRLSIGFVFSALTLVILYWLVRHVRAGRIDLGGEGTYGNRKKRI